MNFGISATRIWFVALLNSIPLTYIDFSSLVTPVIEENHRLLCAAGLLVHLTVTHETENQTEKAPAVVPAPLFTQMLLFFCSFATAKIVPVGR